MTSNTTNSNTC